MRDVKCSYCEEYRNEWCEKVIDSPHPDILRDCQYFHEAKTRWIPCSERLPDESDDYLCTYGSLSGWFVDISIYETEKKEFGFYSENEHGEDVWHPVTNVVAWMPLPEPYKEGQDD